MAPVHEHAKFDDVKRLRALLDKDPRQVEAEEDELGRRRPLHCACFFGNVRAAELLLDRGADRRALDGRKNSPFMLACESKHGTPEVVRLLLARGVDPTERDGDQRTSLMRAVLAGRGDKTAMYMGRFDRVMIMRLLLEDGRVDVNARDSEGRTALRMACELGLVKRARVLLEEGHADYSIADNRGQTPMEAAQHRACDRHLSSDPSTLAMLELLQPYENELLRQKTFLLSKARAVVDAHDSITRAPEKVEAKTEAEAQQAREEAAPTYLKGRVARGEALPELELVDISSDEGKDETGPWLEYVVRWMQGDMLVELMEGCGPVPVIKSQRRRGRNERDSRARRALGAVGEEGERCTIS